MSTNIDSTTPKASGTGPGVKLAIIAVVLLLAAGAFFLRAPQPAPDQGDPVAAASTATPQDTAATGAPAPVAETGPVKPAAVAPKAPAKPLAKEPAAPTAADTPAVRSLPRLVDLGANQCIPCKMMKPVLDDLKVHYGDRFQTTFIDVWENQSAGTMYGIRVIPTQIFYDEKGKELFRHEGFFSKEDILGTWKRLGYAF